MDIFDEIISREDPKVIEQNIRISKLIDRYKAELGEDLNTECFQISDEDLEKALNRCLKEKIRINDIYPGINDIDDDCDY
ncbi:TPA: hypothetical protein ACY4UK_001424 [Clostridium perfringens]